MQLKRALKSVPGLGPLLAAAARKVRQKEFGGSADYWERRYVEGGNSGAGSYNRLAQFKAGILNDFVASNDVRTVIEFGSGDGAQLKLANYPKYVGVDVSKAAIETTRARFASDPSKQFHEASELPEGTQAELSLSLDVIYHLVEDETYERYMRNLFGAATRFVIIYSSNVEERAPAPHVRHRRFTDWVERERPAFALKDRIANAFPFDENDPENSSFADFYIFERA